MGLLDCCLMALLEGALDDSGESKLNFTYWLSNKDALGRWLQSESESVFEDLGI